MRESTAIGALTRFGHALSDPTRARVMLALAEGPAYPSQLAESIGVSRSSMSNHLACLRGCGLVVIAPEGRRSRYELADRRIAQALRDLMGVVLIVDPTCTCGTQECGDCAALAPAFPAAGGTATSRQTLA